MASAIAKLLATPITLAPGVPTRVYKAPAASGNRATISRIDITNTNVGRGSLTYVPAVNAAIYNGICMDGAGNAYFCTQAYDTGNPQIGKLSSTGQFSKMPNLGTTGNISANGIAVDSTGTFLYACFGTGQHTIDRLNLATGSWTQPWAGTLNTSGTSTGVAGTGRFNNPLGCAIDSTNTFLYVCDTANNRVRRVTVSTGAIADLIGNGTATDTAGVGTAATIRNPLACALSADGLFLYIVTGTSSNLLRKYTISSGQCDILAGGGTGSGTTPLDGTGTAAAFANPAGVAVSGDGTKVWVTDRDASTYTIIREVGATSGVVTTIAGSLLPGTGGEGCGREPSLGNGASSLLRWNDATANVDDDSLLMFGASYGLLWFDPTARHWMRLADPLATQSTFQWSTGDAFGGWDAKVRFYHKPSAGSRDRTALWIPQVAVPGADMIALDGPRLLAAGDEIWAVSTHPNVNVAMHGIEVT